MKTYISLLRGINVSGQKKIKMEELRALYESLGLERVATYIQSGNVIFESALKADELVSRIEQSIERQFGYPVTVILRSLSQWREIVDKNPFFEQSEDPSKLHVTLLAEMPEPQCFDKLSEVQSGEDRYVVDGQQLYLHCPNGYGRSKLANTVIERKLKVAATTRNWKSMMALQEMAEAL